MTLSTLTQSLNLTPLTPISADREITSAYACDLLSWVMSHGRAGMAWVTVQTHLNVIAVATLLDLGCVIVPENIEVPAATLAKAAEENVAMFTSSMTAFELCGRMFEMGLRREQDA